jgi:hypothetical protein
MRLTQERFGKIPAGLGERLAGYVADELSMIDCPVGAQ